MQEALLFEPVNKKDQKDEVLVRPAMNYWQDAWRRLKLNKIAIFSLYMIVLILLMAFVGPFLSPYSYSDQSLLDANQSPSFAHWFGTDGFGRDLLVRCLYGARVSLIVGIFASLINITVGVIFGGIAGFLGGKLDDYMMRLVDILYTIPLLLWVILLMVSLGPGLQNVLIAIGAVYWLNMALDQPV